ncbi:MAG: CYTH domain-containing protein [Clostridia bacterium]|nr:CYTH domain-containing protein [Clostridia bacterium]
MEIERKFLIEIKIDIADLEYDDIIQGYVCLEPEIRVRKKGGRYYRTDKSDGEMVREEAETEIPLSVYSTLMENREGGILAKRRYYMPYGKYIIEIDEYKDGLTGLVTAEVEFPTVEEANAFIPPDFLGTEVTFDKRYKNKNLASTGKIPDLQD